MVASALRRLLLEPAERNELALSVEDVLDGRRAKGADQFILEVGVAPEEARRFGACTRAFCTEPRPRQAASDVPLFPKVIQAGQPKVEPLWAQCLREPQDVRRTSDRHDNDAFGVQIPTSSSCQRVEGCLVTPPLDQDCGVGIGADKQFASGACIERRPRTGDAFKRC